MSLLNNPSFMSFGGEPVTGRVPPSVVVYGAGLTRQQQGELAHVYNRFCAANNLALWEFQARHFELTDGSLVRIVSINRVDTVYVWPVGGAVQPILTSCFFSVPGQFQSYGIDAFYPELSTLWRYSGESESPTTLTPSRVVTDAPGTEQHPGNLTWFSDKIQANNKPIILSWYGRANRYGRLDYYGRHGQACIRTSLFNQLYNYSSDYQLWNETRWMLNMKNAVWANGVKHSVYKLDNPNSLTPNKVPIKILSAGLRMIEPSPGAAPVMYLYLITHETRLAVYRGVIDPYDGADVIVEKVADIAYQVDPTPYADTDPQWETLLQPIYFNGSCTFAAGLVSTRKDSPVNPEASAVYRAAIGSTPTYAGTYAALMIKVDVDAGVTTFDSSHASWTETRATDIDYGLGPTETIYTRYMALFDGTLGLGTGTISCSGHDNQSVDTVWTRYGAVDYKEDELLICLTEVRRKRLFSKTGSANYSFTKTAVVENRGWTTTFPIDAIDIGNFTPGQTYPVYAYWVESTTDHTLEMAQDSSALSSYRVYLAGAPADAPDLAGKGSGLVLLDNITTTSRSVSGGGRSAIQSLIYDNSGAPGYGIPSPWLTIDEAAAVDNTTTYTTNATRLENSTIPIYWDVTIEGGDLRHGCVVVGEYAEKGSSYYEASFVASPPDAWAPERLLRSVDGFDEHIGLSPVAESSASLQNRQLVGEFSVWKDGSELFTGGTANGLYPTGYTSEWGGMGPSSGKYNSPPTLNMYEIWFMYPGTRNASYTESTSGLDQLYTFQAYTKTTARFISNPIFSVGWPYINTSAFSTDGEFGFVNVGPFYLANTNNLYDMTSVAKFLFIGDQIKVVDASPQLPDGHTVETPAPPFALALSSPVFLDNVPTR